MAQSWGWRGGRKGPHSLAPNPQMTLAIDHVGINDARTPSRDSDDDQQWQDINGGGIYEQTEETSLSSPVLFLLPLDAGVDEKAHKKIGLQQGSSS